MELRPWSDHAINTRKKLLSFNFLDIVLLQVSLGLPLACFSFPFRGASQIAITSNGGSKPLDTEGACSSRPWDKGKARPQKNFFRPFGPQFGLKIRGGEGGPPGPSPWSATGVVSKSTHLLYFIAITTVDVHCGFGCCALVFCCCCFSCLRDGVVVPLFNPPPLARLNNGWVQRSKRSFITQECTSICTSNLLLVHDTADKKVEKH